eukprot:GILK01005023.1.p1 GENE.GILK01005023.1~~GILK01005023.1.p1  ORF type:complete len:375 (-),score=35.56 GILK01005023.1:147-1238(-)
MTTYGSRYGASMILAGCLDAVGYYNGRWEFNHDGLAIYRDFMSLTARAGAAGLRVTPSSFPVSDDTVMHLATAEGLVLPATSVDDMLQNISHRYYHCWGDMNGRAPGIQTGRFIDRLNIEGEWRNIPFSKSGGGCGAAMRGMCIGLAFPRRSELPTLIKLSVETGRMTHHHPTGYLGSFAGALFTSLAIRGEPINGWGKQLLDSLPLVKRYIEETGRAVQENLEAFGYFTEAWQKYLKEREITDGLGMPKMPDNFGIEQRDQWITSVSYSGWGGSSGHDAPMIAYDALLGANGDWNEVLVRSALHGGDNDSTGTMAGAWFGAMYGLQGVPEINIQQLEYRDRMENLADQLLRVSRLESVPLDG